MEHIGQWHVICLGHPGHALGVHDHMLGVAWGIHHHGPQGPGCMAGTVCWCDPSAGHPHPRTVCTSLSLGLLPQLYSARCISPATGTSVSPAPNHRRNAYGLLHCPCNWAGCSNVIPYPLVTAVHSPVAPASSTAMSSSAGTSASDMHSLLASLIAPSPARSPATSAPMEVDSKLTFDPTKDHGTDTSDIYCNRPEDLPPA